METPDWIAAPDFRAQYPFDWKFPLQSARIAASCAIEDESGSTVALCAAELVPALSLAMQQHLHPLVRLRAGVMIHEYMKGALLAYPEVVCEIPPELERGYGRHLERIFGWRAMWKGYKLMGSQTI
jgi:hypothetical protein